ncbi:hypothetical protein M9Y10_035951 [Tritrichomonas musculus]|uniref:Uncharacterized protein n=1 Tax=Tritrichomonas musculus TaxID=1915356 RepID=A0ABR2GWG8_9EUKA
MNDPVFTQLSARERLVIRKSLDPNVRFYHKSPQSSPRNRFNTSKTLHTQKTTEINENNNEDETNLDEKENKDDIEVKSQNKENKDDTEVKSQTDENKIENSNSTDTENTSENHESPEEEINEIEKNDEPQESENQISNSLPNEEDDSDILSKKLNELSIRHSIQQKIFIQEAEIELKKNNYSPGSLRSFITKTNNLKQKRQDEMIRIYEKYCPKDQNIVKKPITQRNRSKSERTMSNRTNYNNTRKLNLTPRLSMFASNNKTPQPSPRFSAPATIRRDENEHNYPTQIKLPSMSQTQRISKHISLFETQSEKVYNSENAISANLNDPFSRFLSHQELVSLPGIKLNVKPPPPPAKKAAAPRKQSKQRSKSSRMSKMSRKRNLSAMSAASDEPPPPPPPPIKRHILTMRASMIPKSGVIDLDKRDFLDFLNDQEEEIEIKIIEEESVEDDSTDNKSRKKSKSKLSSKSKASSRLKTSSKSKAKSSSKK